MLQHKYRRKHISVIGDSISTLCGYNPDRYTVFYNKAACFVAGITGAESTWWGRVIDSLGGQLLVNNSFSGSQVARIPDSAKIFPSGCSPERTGGLHKGDMLPDIIICFIGMNDFGRGTPLTEKEAENAPLCSFAEAYNRMILDIKKNYPAAEVWLCTLLPAYKQFDPSFTFPNTIKQHTLEDYNRIIRQIAKENDFCRLIDLFAYHTPYDSIDGGHPSATGMATITDCFLQELAVPGLTDITTQ